MMACYISSGRTAFLDRSKRCFEYLSFKIWIRKSDLRFIGLDFVSFRCQFRQGDRVTWAGLRPQVFFLKSKALCEFKSRVLGATLSDASQSQFWMQDASSARDEDFVNNLNGLLEDPDYNVQWTTPSSQPETSASP